MSFASLLKFNFSKTDFIQGIASILVVTSVCILLAYVTGTTDNDKKDQDVMDDDHPISLIFIIEMLMYLFQSFIKSAQIVGFNCIDCLCCWFFFRKIQEEPSEFNEEVEAQDVVGDLQRAGDDNEDGDGPEEEEHLDEVSRKVTHALRIPAYVLPAICWFCNRRPNTSQQIHSD